jgi:hypothetical protein
VRGLGKAVGVVVIGAVVVLGGLRGCGIHEGTATRQVSIQGSGDATALQDDSATIAHAVADGCQRHLGWFGSLVGISGPTGVVVVTTDASGTAQHLTINCGTGKIVKTS